MLIWLDLGVEIYLEESIHNMFFKLFSLSINSLKQDFNKDTLAVSLALYSNKLLQNIFLMMMFEFSSDLLVVIDTIDLRAEMTFSFARLWVFIVGNHLIKFLVQWSTFVDNFVTEFLHAENWRFIPWLLCKWDWIGKRPNISQAANTECLGDPPVSKPSQASYALDVEIPVCPIWWNPICQCRYFSIDLFFRVQQQPWSIVKMWFS